MPSPNQAINKLFSPALSQFSSFAAATSTNENQPSNTRTALNSPITFSHIKSASISSSAFQNPLLTRWKTDLRLPTLAPLLHANPNPKLNISLSPFLKTQAQTGRWQMLACEQSNKQDKTPLITKAQAQGHAVDNVLVTRRPQDFMFSQAAHTDSGFCQGFVLSAFEKGNAFKADLSEADIVQQAQTAQTRYENAFRFHDVDAKKTLYQQSGFQLGQAKHFKTPTDLISHIQS